MASLLTKIMPLPLQQQDTKAGGGGGRSNGGEGEGNVTPIDDDIPLVPASTSLDQGELLKQSIIRKQRQQQSHHHPKRALSVPSFSSIEVLFGNNSNGRSDDERNGSSNKPATSPMDQASMLEKTILEQKQQYEQKVSTSFKDYLFGGSSNSNNNNASWRASLLPGGSGASSSGGGGGAKQKGNHSMVMSRSSPSSPISRKKAAVPSPPTTSSPIIRLHDDEDDMVHDYNHQFKAFKRRFQSFYNSLSPKEGNEGRDTIKGGNDDNASDNKESTRNRFGLLNSSDIPSIPSLSTTATRRNKKDGQEQTTYQVLFLSADTGGGHRASAESLGKQIQIQYPGSTYELLDTFQTEDIFFYKNLCDNYGDMTKNPWQWRIVYHTSNGVIASELFKQHLLYLSLQKIKKRIAQLDPDFIICVHPGMVFNHLYACQELSKEQNRPIPFFVVVTDLGSGHRGWFEPGVSKIYLASDWMNTMAMKMGIHSSKIVRSGLPIRHDFAIHADQLLCGEGGTNNRTSPKAISYQQSIRKQLNLPSRSQTVLLMAGGEGQGSLDEIATYLYLAFKSKNLHATVIVVCGKNTELKETLETKDWDLAAAELQNSINDIESKQQKQRLLLLQDNPTVSPRAALSVITTRIKKELEELRDSSVSPALPLTMVNSGDQNIFDDESSQSRRNYLRKQQQQQRSSSSSSSPTNSDDGGSLSSSGSPRSSLDNNNKGSPKEDGCDDGDEKKEDVAAPTLSPATTKNDDGTTKANDEKAATSSSSDEDDDDNIDQKDVTESLESIASVIGNGTTTSFEAVDNNDIKQEESNSKNESDPSGSSLVASVSSSSAKVKVVPLGFVTKMAEYMVAADILVSKAGPGTIAEAAALGLPMLLTSFLPGQEAGNVDFVVDGKFGIFEQRSPQIAKIVTSWLTNPDKLAELSSNACKAGHPHAAQEIVEDIGSTVHAIFEDAVKTSQREEAN